MSTRIKKTTADGSHAERLKKYFGFHLLGLDIREDAGNIQAQIVYEDFKHIDTVRSELAQMMPEVEFVKIKRVFSLEAIAWSLYMMMSDRTHHPEPELYQKLPNGNLAPTDIMKIGEAELRQLELDDTDDIPYSEEDLNRSYSDNMLSANAIDL